MKLYCVIGVVAVAWVIFGIRQRQEINGLKRAAVEQRELGAITEKKRAELKKAEAEVSDSGELVALRSDKLALMKLRSEISELRKMTNYTAENLGKELIKGRTELVAEQKRADELAQQRKDYYFAKRAKEAFLQVYSGMGQLEGENKKEPQSSEDFVARVKALPEYNPYRKSLLALTASTNEFGVGNFIEVLPSRPVINGELSLRLRERQPRQLADGRWARYYAFSNWQIKEVMLADGAFETWEREEKWKQERE
jgi:hypothetical protein